VNVHGSFRSEVKVFGNGVACSGLLTLSSCSNNYIKCMASQIHVVIWVIAVDKNNSQELFNATCVTCHAVSRTSDSFVEVGST
jgi:hypothetical protein